MVQGHSPPTHLSGPGAITTLDVKRGFSQLDLCSASRGFSPGTAVFPSPQKPTFDFHFKLIGVNC